MEEVSRAPPGPFEDLEVIRCQAGMPTTRFTNLIGMPERTWHRWQARSKDSALQRGPWPMPVSEAAEPTVIKHAEAHPAWGHRKVWAMARYDSVDVSQATVLRIMRRHGLLLPAAYQRERRQLAAARKAAFVNPPTGPNQVWHLDFSEFETRTGGTWRLAACRDYWSKYEFGWHLSPTANQYDAIASIDLATAEAERLADGVELLEQVADHTTGLITPVVIVTDNGGPFRSFRFERYMKLRPDLAHVRTRVRTPGQNGTRERGFGTLKYEWLYRHDIDHGPDLALQAEAYRIEYNAVRLHEAIAWNRPLEVHLGLADPTTPNFPTPKTLPTT